MRYFHTLLFVRSFAVGFAAVGFVAMGVTTETAAAAEPIPTVEMKIVEAKVQGHPKQFRKILVSPTVNTPQPFKGFGGFCGWPKICRLDNGDLFVIFSAGYWHASWPTPLDKYEDADYVKGLVKRHPFLKDWDSPDGAKMMWIRSTDHGKTWSQPKAFPVVRGAYAIGDVTQLSDGTMIAGALIQNWRVRAREKMPTTPLEFAREVTTHLPMKTVIFRSDDNGHTWKEAARISGPFLFMGHPHSFFESPSGDLLMLTNGVPIPAGPKWPTKEARFVSLLMRSQDKGANWETVSVLGSNDFDVEEGSAAYLPDGSIGTPSRCKSAWFQSYDHGKTWSAPRQLHVGQGTATRSLYKKGDLVVTSRGVAVLVFCGGPGGRGQVIYSRDSGKTWIKPAQDRGFKFDELAYYPNACVLEDDSIFVVGDHQGFKNKFGPFGAEVTAVRFRVQTSEEGEGIELLPIGGDSSKK